MNFAACPSMRSTTLKFERQTVNFSAYVGESPHHVDTVEIAFCPLTTLEGISVLTGLKNLRIHYCRNLVDISAITELPMLESVTLYSTPKVYDCASLARINTLTDIELNGPYTIASIKGFEHLPALEYFVVVK